MNILRKTDRDKLEKIHDKLVDQVTAIDRIVLSLDNCSLTKEQRLPIIRASKQIRAKIARLKEAISQIM